MTSRRYCAKCGYPIHFVWLGGRVRPIHDNGHTCAESVRARTFSLPFPSIFPPAFEEPVRRELCRCAQATVFTVQHKDGQSRFDQLHWPWKRHQCSHTRGTDYGLDFLERNLAADDHLNPSLALVAGAKRLGGVRGIHIVAVLNCAEPSLHRCLKVQCESSLPESLVGRARISAGALVGICENGTVRQLATTEGYSFDCIDDHCSPEELDIPADWSGDPLNIRI